MIKKIIIFLAIVGIFLPNLAFLQEEAKEMGIKVVEEIRLNFASILKKIWKEEAIPVWQKLWNFFKKLWNSYLYPTIKKLWQKIATPFKKEIERRKPIIEEEFKKEKQELKTEVPKFGKSLWERFKELIK